MKLECCHIPNLAQIFFVEPTRENVYEEVAIVAYYESINNQTGKQERIYKTKCCNRPLVELRQLVVNSKNEFEILPPRRLISKSSKAYIEKLPEITIFKSKVVSPNFKVENRWYLNYSEFGTVKKCYSNLSTCMLGRLKNIYEDLDNSNNFILNR